jgi:Serine hydrolase (FSH1)
MVDDTPSTTPATDETPSSRNSSRSGFHSFSRSDGAMLGPSLRILCLHDGHSNAGELSDQLEVLGERLYEKHMIDLVYVNAPLLVKGSISETSYDLSPLNSNPQRIWWDEEATNGTPKYVGLDASLLLLRQIWNSMPFWGVIAVGKGAAAAAFLPLLPVSSPPQFMIFIRGETILEETELLVEDALSSTCLHMIEASPPKESSERLWRQFGGRVVVMGLAEQLSNKAMNLMGKVCID